MCGIAGFVGRGDRSVIERMTARLSHRGPDDDGFFVEPERALHLGHRRLSILDHAGGHQPMSTPDGAVTIVFNGEIYNFRELRAELERAGAVFRSDHSDTEVLLHGYLIWGERLPERLNGMWAFALYDRRTQRLICSRDRFGKKPFYYFAAPGVFAFASELHALREHPAVPGTADTTALRKYFAYGFIPAPLALIKGVRKLPGGHSLTVDLRTLDSRLRCDWRYRPEPDQALLRRPIGELTDELIDRLDKAVARRLVADVPVGAFLSGGVDSSTVAALAMRHVGAERLQTFSIGFEEASFDESRYAKAAAAHIGARHRQDTLSVDSARDMLPELLSRLDEPMADSSLLPTWLLCRHARREVTVAIGGDGADELFGGYSPFQALRYARWYERLLPRPVHRSIAALMARLPVSHRYMSFDFRLKRLLRGLDHEGRLWLPVWMAPLAPVELSELLAEPIDIEEVFSEAIEAWDRWPGVSDVDRATSFFVELYLQDDILAKVDRASMLHSLEVRSPFLDIEVADFARRLPAALKVRGRQGKWLLKRAAERLLPRELVYRRKQGFAVPVGRWFADTSFAAPSLSCGPRSDFWQRRLVEHRAGRADHRLYLWSELVLSSSGIGAAESSPIIQTS